MYHTNGLWYARVGNANALIDTTKTPSVCAAKYDHLATPTSYASTPPSTKTIDNKVINIFLQDSILESTTYETPHFQHNTP